MNEMSMLGRRAYLRRRAMNQAGVQTYEVRPDGRSILCMCCGRASFHLEDISNKYCVFCGVYHEEELTHAVN